MLQTGDNLMLNELLLSKKYKIVRHAGALAAIALFAFNFLSVYRQPYAFWLNATMFLHLLLLFYINMYWLVPVFLLREKLLAYSFFILLYVGLSFIGIDWLHNHFAEYRISAGSRIFPDRPGFLPFAFTTFIMAGASAAIKLLQQWIRDKEKLHALQELTTQSELETLRNQISPHFLFNMLNNANLLTYKDPGKASQVLLGLSDILKYQLYDCHRKEVLLRSEIKFLEEFLLLESVRRDSFEFDIEVEGNVHGIMVPPMLFIVFLENAVKHSADPGALSYVYVSFIAEDDRLQFRCHNSKPMGSPGLQGSPGTHGSPDPQGSPVLQGSPGVPEPISRFRQEGAAPGGIGLTNARRRLDLLKPGSHSIDIEENEDCYSLALNMVI